MLTFLGHELWFTVNEVLERHGDHPAVCSAADDTGRPWLVVEVDDRAEHLVWVCVPASGPMLEAVVDGRAELASVIRHSVTGWVDVVTVEQGRAAPDSCVLCAAIPADWAPVIRSVGGGVTETISRSPTRPAPPPRPDVELGVDVEGQVGRGDKGPAGQRRGGTMTEERPTVMSVTVAESIRARVCLNKRRLNRRDAQILSAKCNVTAEAGRRTYNAYPCPFSEGARHWHVGHLIAVDDMATLGLAIRTLRPAA